MTVNFEIPIIKYQGNGNTTDFTFAWSSGDPNEIYVKLDDTLLTEGIEYELEDYTADYGGTIVFNDAPTSSEIITIYRETPITQQVDYVDFESFPADTHEFQMDKDTRILQEMIFGGRSFATGVDLSATQYPEYVEVENTAGTNAILNPWTCNGLLAGVFLGEFLQYGQQRPVDGASTTKHDGYIWWSLGPGAYNGGDTNIIMGTGPITYADQQTSPTVSVAEFRYDAASADIMYGFDVGSFTSETALTTPPSALEGYWIKFEIVTGGVTERDNSPVDTWIDAYSTIGQPAEYMGWYVSNPGGTSASVAAIFHLAPDNGAAAPDIGKAISRYVTLTAEQI
jgi:hypothetical protein